MRRRRCGSVRYALNGRSMITRRDFLQVAAATAAVTGLGGAARPRRRAAAHPPGGPAAVRAQGPGHASCTWPTCHAQLKPLYFREPSLNLGVGEASGQLPHITGASCSPPSASPAGSPDAYMLTSADFEALATTYGRVGGMDRMATLVKAIRAERGAERVLLLDGGDALQGSYTALATKGGDMVARAGGAGRRGDHRPLGVHARRRARRRAVRRHRIGRARRARLPRRQRRDTDFEEPVFDAMRSVRDGRRQASPSSARPSPTRRSPTRAG